MDRNPLHSVRVVPAGLELEVHDGESLLDAGFRVLGHWPTACYGQARCTLCHVRVLADLGPTAPPGPAEAALLARVARREHGGDTAGLRLACCLRVVGDLVVEHHGVSAPSGS